NKDGLITTNFLANKQENGITLVETYKTLIGGTNASARNIISGNNSGIHAEGSDQNIIKGNYIGVDSTGTVTGGFSAINTRGIYLNDSNQNPIGGTESGAGNLISGNVEGIELFGSENILVQGNLIGTNA